MYRFFSKKSFPILPLIENIKTKNNLIGSGERWKLYFNSLPLNMKKQIIELKLNDNDLNDFETKMSLMYAHKSFGD